MFLDQDQMYLRMCNVNKEKISLENSPVVLHLSASMYPYLSSIYAKHLCAQFLNYLNVKKFKFILERDLSRFVIAKRLIAK